MDSIATYAKKIFRFCGVQNSRSRGTAIAKPKHTRYRLDSEDVVQTAKFDAIDVASISPEIRAEI